MAVAIYEVHSKLQTPELGQEPLLIFPQHFVALLGTFPSVGRALKVFDQERRKKLLSLADFLLKSNPVESTARTVNFLVKISQPHHEPEPLLELPWLSRRLQSDFDALANWDPNNSQPVRQLLPQMRFVAKIGRRPRRA